MQNKPNLLATQMNVSSVKTKDCENEIAFWPPKNKPKTNPIKACPERSRMGQFRT
jgi:hypothetical protein